MLCCAFNSNNKKLFLGDVKKNLSRKSYSLSKRKSPQSKKLKAKSLFIDYLLSTYLDTRKQCRTMSAIVACFVVSSPFARHVQCLLWGLCTLQGSQTARQWKRPPVWGPGLGWCSRWMNLWLPARLRLVFAVWGSSSVRRGRRGRAGRRETRSQRPGWRLETERRAEVWCGPPPGGHSSGSSRSLGCISVVRGQ